MASEHRIAGLRHLQTLLRAGAVGAMADRDLLERFLAGHGDADSSAAFAALVDRHGPMVLRVCRDVLRNQHDAEDASQATFLVLARRGGSIRRADSLASWLFGVARRVATRARADAARRRAIERRGSAMKSSTDREGDAQDLGSELYTELDRLPESYRAPIVLCDLEGLTNEQAAGQLGIPVRTVQRRLAEGRERLRGRLVRHGLSPTAGLLGSSFTVESASELWVEATVRAASELAEGRALAALVSAPVAALTQGVLTMMLMGRLKAVAGGILAVGAVVMALAGAGASLAARRHPEPAAPRIDLEQAAVPLVTMAGPWIKGLVVDEAGKRVPGARVSSYWKLTSRSVTSAADGTFVIANDEPRVANLAFLATADGGARQGIFRFQDLTRLKGPRTLARIVLKPARTVTVSVVDARRTPVEGAVVVLLDMAWPVAEAKTDARGVALLRACRRMDAMDLRVQAKRGLRLLRELPEHAGNTVVASSGTRPTGPRRHAHRPRPGARLGRQARAGRRDRSLDDPQERKAWRSQHLRVRIPDAE